MATTDYPRNYACCKCQERHYSGDYLFEAHLMHQSKHGFQHSQSYEPYRPAHLRPQPKTEQEAR